MKASRCLSSSGSLQCRGRTLCLQAFPVCRHCRASQSLIFLKLVWKAWGDQSHQETKFLWGVQAEGRHMLAAGYGRIINTASMASLLVPHPQKQVCALLAGLSSFLCNSLLLAIKARMVERGRKARPRCWRFFEIGGLI